MPDARILFVEDDEIILELMGISMRGAGYAVDAVRTVATANVRLDSFQYDLVVADCRLPDGDGIAIVDRAAHLGVKTIIFSAYLLMVPAVRTVRHQVLMKPVRPPEFMAMVRRCLGHDAGCISN